jgi:mercuric ion transport protein
MTGRVLIATGTIGAVVAAICCATPVLGIVLGSIGLSAWLAGTNYIVLPVLILGVALTGFGLYRRLIGYHDAASREQSHE